MKDVYLDWAATSPADSEILHKALALSLDAYANPSSNHWLGKEAKKLLEEARTELMRTLGVEGGLLVFTGSGSEADHIPLLALVGRLNLSGTRKPLHIVVSAIEHSAIDCQVRALANLGVQVSWINPDSRGKIEPAKVLAHLRKETALVSVMGVNNETGAIQNIAAIGQAIGEATLELGLRKPWFHVDAVQMLGKLPMHRMSTYVDSFAISAHKIRGPRGIGALWLSRPLDAFVCGGGQESGIRPGTENLFGALAFRFAVEKVSESLDTYTLRARQLETRIIEGVSHIQGAFIVPERAPGDEAYVPSILSIAFPGLGGETMVRALSGRHIAVSTGSACSSNQRHRGRRVLQAMGVPDDIAFSAIRVSTGPLTTPEEIDIFLEQAEDLYRKLKT
ncbi:MAG TPA: cysteine desulfurase [Spirochaetaceae bacterium]|nr:cysteine desulfurase [Spirochaetaceae bacterium]